MHHCLHQRPGRKNLQGLLPLLFAFSLLAPAGASAQDPGLTPLWSRSFGGLNGQFNIWSDCDASGNIYIVGYFQNEVNLGGETFTTAGTSDMDAYVAKYTPSGGHIWSRRYGGLGYQKIVGVHVDRDGDVLVAGYVVGTIDFGGGPVGGAGSYDIFLAKLDADGNHLWSHGFGDAQSQVAFWVSSDSAGNVLLTGDFIGDVDFGGGVLTSAGNEDMFVAKFDPDGGHLWSRRYGGTLYQLGFAIEVDQVDNILVAGYFWNDIDFGGGTLTSAGQGDVLLVKLDPDGEHLWSRRFGDAAEDDAYALGIDPSGNVLLTGCFDGAIDFGGGEFVAGGGKDIFLAKFNPGGSHLWSRGFGGAEDQTPWAVESDEDGNVYLSGQFKGAVDFGDGMHASEGYNDIFAAIFDAAGDCLWSDSYGGPDDDVGCGLSLDPGGGVVLHGSFNGTLPIGGNVLTSSDNYDIFLARFDATAGPPAPTILTDGDIRDEEWTGAMVLGDGETEDSTWAPGNALESLLLSWDHNFLYVGLRGRTENNSWLIYLDVDPRSGLGQTDLTAIDVWERGAVFTAEGFAPDFQYGCYQHQSQYDSDFFYQLTSATTSVDLTTEIQSGFDSEQVFGAEGGSEIAIPWSTLYGGAPLPAGATVGVAAALCWDPEPDGKLGGDSIPNNRTAALPVLDRAWYVKVDADDDGVPDPLGEYAVPDMALISPDPEAPAPLLATPGTIDLEWSYEGAALPAAWRLEMSFDGGAHAHVLDVIDDPSGSLRTATLSVPPVSTVASGIRVSALDLAGELLGSATTVPDQVLVNDKGIYFDVPWDRGEGVWRDTGIVLRWEDLEEADKYVLEIKETGISSCADLPGIQNELEYTILPHPVTGVLPTYGAVFESDLARMPAARYEVKVKRVRTGWFDAIIDTQEFILCRLGDFKPEARDLKPVILVHGWTDDAGIWYWRDQSPLVTALASGGQGHPELHPWTFEYPNLDMIALSGGALSEAIRLVLALSSHDEVSLVTHSMGGLVSRTYLQSVAAAIQGVEGSVGPFRHDVDRLVTLSTPHLGVKDVQVFVSSFTKDWDFIYDIAAGDREFICDPLVNMSGSVRDLADDSQLVQVLAQRPLPSDVEYFLASGSTFTGELFFGRTRYETQLGTCESGSDATVTVCSGSAGLCPSTHEMAGVDAFAGHDTVRRFYGIGHTFMARPGALADDDESQQLLADVLEFLDQGGSALESEPCPPSPLNPWRYQLIDPEGDLIMARVRDTYGGGLREGSALAAAGTQTVPIPGATVRVHDLRSEDPVSGMVYVSDAEGLVSPRLADGSYELSFDAPGRELRVERIVIDGAEDTATWLVDLPADAAYAGPRNPTLLIEGGSSVTTDSLVTLSLSCEEAAEVQIASRADFEGAAWLPMSSGVSWNLGSEFGTKAVYARFRGASGDTSGVVLDTIDLSTGDWGGIAVTASVPGATVVLDGRRLPRTAPTTLDSLPPGFHAVALEAPGYFVTPPSRTVAVVAAGTAAADFILSAAAPPAPVDPASLGEGLYQSGEPLAWAPPPGESAETRYNLGVFADSLRTQPVMARSGLVDTTYGLGGAIPDSTAYFVSIEAINGQGLTADSGVRRILLDHTPPTLEILALAPTDTVEPGAPLGLETAVADWGGVAGFAAYLSTDGGATWGDTLMTGAWASPAQLTAPAYGRADSCLVMAAAWDAAGNTVQVVRDSLLLIFDGVTDVAGPGGSLTRFSLMSANPQSSSTALRVEVPPGSRARVAVYDIRGRRLRVLLDEPIPSGRREVVWDGRDDGGRRVATGVYLLRFEAAGRSSVRKIALVR